MRGGVCGTIFGSPVRMGTGRARPRGRGGACPAAAAARLIALALAMGLVGAQQSRQCGAHEHWDRGRTSCVCDTGFELFERGSPPRYACQESRPPPPPPPPPSPPPRQPPPPPPIQPPIPPPASPCGATWTSEVDGSTYGLAQPAELCAAPSGGTDAWRAVEDPWECDSAAAMAPSPVGDGTVAAVFDSRGPLGCRVRHDSRWEFNWGFACDTVGYALEPMCCDRDGSCDDGDDDWCPSPSQIQVQVKVECTTCAPDHIAGNCGKEEDWSWWAVCDDACAGEYLGAHWYQLSRGQAESRAKLLVWTKPINLL
jgi:hypothetical protein